MSDEKQRHEVTLKRLVFDMKAADAVRVRRDIQYGERPDAVMDVYELPRDGSDRPAVVIVSGYPDERFQSLMGCPFKDMEWTISWARLIAASGLVAITSRAIEPANDAHALLSKIHATASSHGIDAERIGVLSSSGSVPTAMSLLMNANVSLRCAALLYGYMLDLDGDQSVAKAAAGVGFANPSMGRSVSDLARHVPLLIVRCGNDEMPGLNGAIDRFTHAALELNLALTLVNHPDATHAFDLFHDSAMSRAIIQQVLAFLQAHC